MTVGMTSTLRLFAGRSLVQGEWQEKCILVWQQNKQVLPCPGKASGLVQEQPPPPCFQDELEIVVYFRRAPQFLVHWPPVERKIMVMEKTGTWAPSSTPSWTVPQTP